MIIANMIIANMIIANMIIANMIIANMIIAPGDLLSLYTGASIELVIASSLNSVERYFTVTTINSFARVRTRILILDYVDYNKFEIIKLITESDEHEKENGELRK